jgi:DNA-binding HxlR family transcriptional regulator
VRQHSDPHFVADQNAIGFCLAVSYPVQVGEVDPAQIGLLITKTSRQYPVRRRCHGGIDRCVRRCGCGNRERPVATRDGDDHIVDRRVDDAHVQGRLAREFLSNRDDGVLGIVRELILGSHRFNEIERGLPGISRSLLASRLRDLEDAGLIERLRGPQPKAMAYHLSEAGRDLKTVIETLGGWGVRWAFGEPRPEELDAGLLIWKIHQRINRELLPDRRTVVEFDFTPARVSDFVPVTGRRAG